MTPLNPAEQAAEDILKAADERHARSMQYVTSMLRSAMLTHASLIGEEHEGYEFVLVLATPYGAEHDETVVCSSHTKWDDVAEILTTALRKTTEESDD